MDRRYVGQKQASQQMKAFVETGHDERTGSAVFDELSLGLRKEHPSNHIPFDGCFNEFSEPTLARTT